MEQRLADIEDLMLDPRRIGGGGLSGGLGRAREFACVMRDSMHGRSFVGKSHIRIDAEVADVSECQRIANNFHCQAKPICEEIDSLTSVVCVIRDSPPPM